MSKERRYINLPRVTCSPAQSKDGITLLELIVVMFLITLILATSTVFLSRTLPSRKFDASVREMTATIRHARQLALSKGEEQAVTINLDTGEYGIKGYSKKNIPAGINIKVVDSLSGEKDEGIYKIIFYAIGSVEGETVVLWNEKKRVDIEIDPVAGATVKGET
jgi:type II secretory pathway pseudopilin PulG